MLWNRLHCHFLPAAPSAAERWQESWVQAIWKYFIPPHRAPRSTYRSPPQWITAARWQALFDRLNLINGLPAGQLIIHDFGATPGVARIRIEQVFEEAAHA